MKTKKMFSWLFAFVAVLLVFSTNVKAVSYKAGGECGKDLKWSLDYNGNLFIYGEGPMTNYGMWDYNDKGWSDYTNEIRTVTVEKGVTTIGRSAFWECKNLKTVKLPPTLDVIESDAFNRCTSLSSINLPNGLKELGSSVFEKCSSLTKIKIPETLTNLGDKGYGLHTFSETGLTEIFIPSSVTKMAAYCFENCPNLTSATIVGSNLEIDFQAFKDCKKLTTVKMGSGVTSMRSGAFANCSALRNLTLGKNLVRIEDSAFENCTSLREVVIPDKVTTIKSREYDTAFGGCTSLETVTFGLGVTEIGDYAFQNCPALKTVKFCGSAPKFEGNGTFAGCGNLTAYYPSGSKTWDRSNMTAHGAARIDWKSWTPPIDHFAPVLKSVSASSKGVAVTWNKMSGATGYEVWRSTGNGKYEKVKTITSGSTTGWTDTKVTNGKRYTYRIYGTNGKVISKVSSSKYLYYLTRNSEALYKYGSGMKVRWKSNSAATGYVIEYSAKSNFSGAKRVYVKDPKSTYKIIYPGIRGNCYVRVRTYKTVNGKNSYSAWSSTKSIRL